MREADYFFTEDLAMDTARVVELYAARWGIEEAIREAKQVGGSLPPPVSEAGPREKLDRILAEVYEPVVKAGAKA